MLLPSHCLPRTFDRVKIIYRGKTSQVYYGVHKKSGEKVAIKVIDRRRIVANPDLIAEVSVLKKLSHPNIIGLKDVFITLDNLQIVMELYVKPDSVLTKIQAARATKVASFEIPTFEFGFKKIEKIENVWKFENPSSFCSRSSNHARNHPKHNSFHFQQNMNLAIEDWSTFSLGKY